VRRAIVFMRIACALRDRPRLIVATISAQPAVIWFRLIGARSEHDDLVARPLTLIACAAHDCVCAGRAHCS